MASDIFLDYFHEHFKRTSSFISGIALMFIDCLSIMLSIGIGFFIVNAINPHWINFRSFVTYSVYLPFILIVFYASSLYPGILLAPQEEVKRFSLCTFFAFMGIAISINIENKDRIAISAALILAWPFATVILPVFREMSRRLFGKFHWWGVPAVVYTKGDEANVIVDRLSKHHHYGYIPTLIITDRIVHDNYYNGIPVYTSGDEINAAIKASKVKVAIICGYNKEPDKIINQYRYIIQIPKELIRSNMTLHMRDFGGILGFSSTNYLTKQGALFGKRCMDILLCLIALPLVILVSIPIVIAIKTTSPGPVLYAHKRVGKNHKVIKCWKFRSMVIDSQERLEEILKTDPVRAAEWEKDRKFTDDPRVTKVGKFIRKTSLDEVPQLWNIFVGDMSFIGPRPVTEPELVKYGNYADYVLSVSPGLSGMWQISGRSDTGYEERITLDSYYIQNWSIWLDIWILIKTIWVVINGKGAY